MLNIAMVIVGAAIAIVLVVIVHLLREMHLAMNSRLDKLLLTTEQLAHAEGFKAGQEDHLQALRDFKG